MPLMAQLSRDGQPLPLRWGYWHLQVIGAAIAKEHGEDPAEAAWDWAFKGDGHIFRSDHSWLDSADGEVLHIKAGDRYMVHR